MVILRSRVLLSRASQRGTTSEPHAYLETKTDQNGEALIWQQILIAASGKSHPAPYSEVEKQAILEAKSMEPDMTEVWNDQIFIGNKKAVEDVEYLVKHKITHVVNCASEARLTAVAPDLADLERHHIAYKAVPLRDVPEQQIAFIPILQCIRDVLTEKADHRVLINCWAGCSRSASVTLAYLVLHEQMPLPEALIHVKSRRDIHPNIGFLKQLIDFASSIVPN
eukprot:GEMP01048734.1.p1 GENE.GEMP01048734.1~~GEMP01048734.1.p1  ORF type:complete len:224 (+),score=56.40 GEMP01048734.1:441-1112(+)